MFFDFFNSVVLDLFIKEQTLSDSFLVNLLLVFLRLRVLFHFCHSVVLDLFIKEQTLSDSFLVHFLRTFLIIIKWMTDFLFLQKRRHSKLLDLRLWRFINRGDDTFIAWHFLPVNLLLVFLRLRVLFHFCHSVVLDLFIKMQTLSDSFLVNLLLVFLRLRVLFHFCHSVVWDLFIKEQTLSDSFLVNLLLVFLRLRVLFHFCHSVVLDLFIKEQTLRGITLALVTFLRAFFCLFFVHLVNYKYWYTSQFTHNKICYIWSMIVLIFFYLYGWSFKVNLYFRINDFPIFSIFFIKYCFEICLLMISYNLQKRIIF